MSRLTSHRSGVTYVMDSDTPCPDQNIRSTDSCSRAARTGVARPHHVAPTYLSVLESISIGSSGSRSWSPSQGHIRSGSTSTAIASTPSCWALIEPVGAMPDRHLEQRTRVPGVEDPDRVLAPIRREDAVRVLVDQRSATPVNPPIESMQRPASRSIMSSVSFAVWATYRCRSPPWTAAWSKPPARRCAGRSM